MKIERLEPLECPNCNSSNVSKRGKHIDCYDCHFSCDTETGKKTKMTKDKHGKGHNPRYDTGDYLE